MKTIALLCAAIVAGAIRYPTEGPLQVKDDEAERLVENKQAELVEVEDDNQDEGDGLEGKTVAGLRELAGTEEVDLADKTLKADIIAAIRHHREPAA